MFDGKATNLKNNKIENYNYILDLIKNKVNPLHPLDLLNYTMQQHSYKNSDNITG